MLAIKRNMVTIAVLFNPLGTTDNLALQLHNFFSAQLAGAGDEVRASIRIAPNLLPLYEQSLPSIDNNSRLRDSVSVLTCRGSDRRYL